MCLRSAILATALTILPTAAFADTLTVYKVTGSFVEPVTLAPDSTLGGTLTFDSTTGAFTADTLGIYSDSGTLVESFLSPTAHQSLLPDGRYELELFTYDFSFGPPPSGYGVLDLKLPGLPVSNQGLNLCSLSNVCIPPVFPNEYESLSEGVVNQHSIRQLPLASGQLTPVAMTPEPSSFMLLGTGLFALCLLAWPSLRMGPRN